MPSVYIKETEYFENICKNLQNLKSNKNKSIKSGCYLLWWTVTSWCENKKSNAKIRN